MANKRFLLFFLLVLAGQRLISQPEELYQYINPLPDARFVSRYTTISTRFSGEYQPFIVNTRELFFVTGTTSGLHTGEVILSDDRQTVIFKPHQPFDRSEKVSVRISPVLKNNTGPLKPLEYHFFISDNDNFFLNSSNRPSNGGPGKLFEHTQFDSVRTINGVSVPDDFPGFKSKKLGPTAPGNLFLANWGGTPYIMILKNDGTPLFYRRLPYRSMDFKVHRNGTLTRWAFEGIEGYLAMDSSYAVVDTFRCRHGYATDEHGIEILDNGHYMLIAKDFQQMDMSKLVEGGREQATVVGNHIQIMDTHDNVVFEWRCWDHFNIEDAEHQDLTAQTIHPYHINAATFDLDGHILISSRHLSQITKIDRHTGKIIWRLGGVQNQFEFLNDENKFSYQHDIRPVSGMPLHYTLFDNGNYHNPPHSRALELKIDTVFMNAYKMWEYKPEAPRHAVWMGNVQRLPNGNTLINWAERDLPKVTEVDPQGKLLFEGDFKTKALCYRSFRFDWLGKAAVPYLIVESSDDKIKLIFNKFGDHVHKYNIYGGLFPEPSEILASTEKNWHILTGLVNEQTHYFYVTAVDSTGNESGFSNREAVFVKYIDSGENQIINGDFSKGLEGWTSQFQGGAQGHVSVNEAGQYHISVDDGGSSLSQVQFVQSNIKLRQGAHYQFEFDARADDTKTIEVKIENQLGPRKNYADIGYISLTSRMQKYRFSFKMFDKTDYNARLVFNCGNTNSDVWIDNISLIQDAATPVVQNDKKPQPDFLLYNNYPNPFNSRTNIKFSLAKSCIVRIDIYNTKGQQVKFYPRRRYGRGLHSVTFDAENMAAGCYFYRIVVTAESGYVESVVKKMLYIR